MKVLKRNTMQASFVLVSTLCFVSQEAFPRAPLEVVPVVEYQLLDEGKRFALLADEALRGEDLNGDNDLEDKVLQLYSIESDETENLGYAVESIERVRLCQSWLLFLVAESSQGEDRNGDGDMEDQVLHAYDIDRAETRNTAGAVKFVEQVQLSESWLFYLVVESSQGRDLNGDSDEADEVLHVYNTETDETRNLGLDSSRLFEVSGSWLATAVSESDQSEHLNGDRDMEDRVLHIYDLEHDETVNLRQSVSYSYEFLSEEWTGFMVDEDAQSRDLNGDDDMGDEVYHLYNLETREIRNLALAGTLLREYPWSASQFILGKSSVVVFVGESVQGCPRGSIYIHDLPSGETRRLAVVNEWSIDCVRDPWDSLPCPSGYNIDRSGSWLLFQSTESELYLLNIDTGEIRNIGPGDWDSLLVTGDRLMFSRDGTVHVHDLETCVTERLPFAGAAVGVCGKWLVSQESKSCFCGVDVDHECFLLHLCDFETREVTTFGQDAAGGAAFVRFVGDWLLFTQSWATVDDPCGEPVDALHAYNLKTGEARNLGGLYPQLWSAYGDQHLAYYSSGRLLRFHNLAMNEIKELDVGRSRFLDADGPWVVITVYEPWGGEDLNGDGDTEDYVLQVLNVADERVINVSVGVPLRYSQVVLSLTGNVLAFEASEASQGRDLNGDGDVEDYVMYVADLTAVASLPGFLRADCNADGSVDISDAVATLFRLFLDGTPPECEDACDANDDGQVDVSDAIATLGMLFLGQGSIPLPGVNSCGFDPTDDRLTCEAYEACPQ